MDTLDKELPNTENFMEESWDYKRCKNVKQETSTSYHGTPLSQEQEHDACYFHGQDYTDFLTDENDPLMGVTEYEAELEDMFRDVSQTYVPITPEAKQQLDNNESAWYRRPPTPMTLKAVQPILIDLASLEEEDEEEEEKENEMLLMQDEETQEKHLIHLIN